MVIQPINAGMPLPASVNYVDLGTLTWSLRNGYGYDGKHIFKAYIPGMRETSLSSIIVSDDYTSVSTAPSSMTDKSARAGTVGGGDPELDIRDEDFANAAQFKEHITGVLFLFK